MGLKENLIEIGGWIVIFIIIIAALLGAIIAYQKYAYQWDFNDLQLSHDRYSIVSPKLVEINWDNGPLPIKIDGQGPLPLDYKGGNGFTYYEYIGGVNIISNQTTATIFKLPIGEHNLQIGKDEVVVRVFASASEMNVEKEPGFEGLVAILAIAIIFTIAKRIRAGG